VDYCVFKCYFSVENKEALDHDLSSSIRGIWGRNLKQIFCMQRNIECQECTFNHCPYFSIFEKKYGENDEYRPYIIYHNQKNKTELEVHFILLGFLTSHYDKVLLPILQIAEKPLFFKGEKLHLKLIRILDQEDHLIVNNDFRDLNRIHISQTETKQHDEFQKVKLIFQTPLRMKYQNQLMKQFNFEAFVKSLIRRLNFINEYFSDRESDTIIFNPDFLQCQVSSNLIWREKYRKSFRQNQKMSIGGLIGNVIIEKPHPELVLILKTGELVQAGKQTAFGNGKYFLECEQV